MKIIYCVSLFILFAGKTYWGTFVSCEEFSGAGHCWEVDPNTGHTAQTNVVPRGGNYGKLIRDHEVFCSCTILL